ncbi:MAG: cytochrome c oxidase subunit II [Alphaproteobacteria bacterium]
MAKQNIARTGRCVDIRQVTCALVAGGVMCLADAASAGQPEAWGMYLQPGASPVRDHMDSFHTLLMWTITFIALFVTGLLAYVILRFNKRAHPKPDQFAHNTTLEVVWTAVPIIILFVIAIPSMQLLYFGDRIAKSDMTIKVVGHQWYWSYEYPDHGNFSLDARALWDGPATTDQQALDLAKEVSSKWLIPTDPPLRLLETDNRMVVPVGANIRILLAATDVLHAWYVPALGVQAATVPGRLNEVWFKADREGVYYGQCTQICGTGHGYMPTVVEAVSPERFAAWVKSKQTTGAIEPQSDDVQLATAKAAR